MANVYETVLVFSLKNGEEAVSASLEKFKGLIEANGTIDNVDEWGKRRLAYPINYENDGYYVVITHTAEPTFVSELARKLNIADDVLRYLTVSKEA